MIELLFKKKHSKLVFNICLFVFCVGFAFACAFLIGGLLINYLIGGVFWVTGRYFYQKIDRIVNAAVPSDEPNNG